MLGGFFTKFSYLAVGEFFLLSIAKYRKSIANENYPVFKPKTWRFK